MSYIDPYQYTLNNAVSCCGVGLHSGRTVNLSILPAAEDCGIRFYRTDMPSRQYVMAHMDKVVDTRLATTLGNGIMNVSGVEHVMAALSVYGITNASIEVDGPEIPIMDGSAEPFFQLLKVGGKKRQKQYRKALRITKKISYVEGDKHLSISPYDGLKVTGEISFDGTLIRNQRYCYDFTRDDFINVSRARTFGYVEKMEELWANGLALGGSLANVVAIHWNRKSVLNEDGLRYEDEFVRHKVLDLVGDIALLGCFVLGHINAYKCGHSHNLKLMQAIAASPNCWEMIELKSNKVLLDSLGKAIHVGSEVITPLFNAHVDKLAKLA